MSSIEVALCARLLVLPLHLFGGPRKLALGRQPQLGLALHLVLRLLERCGQLTHLRGGSEYDQILR